MGWIPSGHSIPTSEKPEDWYNPIDGQLYYLIRNYGPVSRQELVKRTGLPRTTVYDALTRLKIRQLVLQFSEPRSTPGRPRVLYNIVIKPLNQNRSSHQIIEGRLEGINLSKP